MISIELPLLISIRWMLNPSILSIITSGLSYGCLMPQASLSKKTMSGSLLLNIFDDGYWERILFTSLVYAFFRDFKDPPTPSPLVIILISPIGALLHFVSYSLSFLSFWCRLYEFFFRTNLYSFPCRIKISIWSFRCLHSSMRYPWSWWNLQYLLLSLTFVRA